MVYICMMFGLSICCLMFWFHNVQVYVQARTQSIPKTQTPVMYVLDLSIATFMHAVPFNGRPGTESFYPPHHEHPSTVGQERLMSQSLKFHTAVIPTHECPSTVGQERLMSQSLKFHTAVMIVSIANITADLHVVPSSFVFTHRTQCMKLLTTNPVHFIALGAPCIAPKPPSDPLSVAVTRPLTCAALAEALSRTLTLRLDSRSITEYQK